jgi:hypothetical protein
MWFHRDAPGVNLYADACTAHGLHRLFTLNFP